MNVAGIFESLLPMMAKVAQKCGLLRMLETAKMGGAADTGGGLTRDAKVQILSLDEGWRQRTSRLTV